ncbi:OLC1v1020666C1 [Oldenlandia corymbosa var. corymbosa]|uniref:OLC1v1020666C1 n=1 Tax=Oldenlandia corymbosa var. corymbosa TaxID=529605 RepID=A0AAV1EGY0_OLDCO|nr:OLC1v1020666C1 [Oldenlandia corymbosa var. corymbosa]
MAVTHADLEPSPPSSDLGSKTGACLMVLSIFFGLFCFILCLLAEATRSQVTWSSDEQECVYSGSGKVPLLCGAAAFVALAIAMIVEHTFMLISISRSTSSPLVIWDPDSDFAKSVACQAAFFFVSTWICFAVGEILLLIGLSIESGHLKNWATPKSSCLILRPGMFTSAGVFGLLTVFLAAGLYITALRAQRALQDQENVRREVLEAASSAIYTTPTRLPPLPPAVVNQNTVATQYRSQRSLSDYLTEFEKYSYL